MRKLDAKTTFKSSGARVNVSSDCIIGENTTVEDEVSVKKSVLGKECSLKTGVKISCSVILEGVTIERDVNLTGCIICEDVIIGENCTLKQCRVARGVRVAANTDANDGDLTTEKTFDEYGLGGEFLLL